MLGLSGLVGCGTFQCGCGNGCRTKSPYAGMKYDACCETCGPNCGPSCGRGGACCCGSACEGCGDGVGCAGACGTKGCRKCWFFGMFDCAGCGGCYWNEWYNDPPARCEPCDCHGNYIGPGNTGYYQAPYLHQAEYAGPAAMPSVAPLEEAPPVPEHQVDGELDKLGVEAE